MNLFIPQLKKELLLAVRDKKSQNYINRKLGVNYNQVSKWETNQTRILWLDFVKLCTICNIKLKDALGKIINFYGNPSDFKNLTKHLIAKNKYKEISSKLNCSRYTVSHWVNGKSCPTLENILALMELKNELLHFIANIIDINKVPSIKPAFRKHEMARDLISLHPIACLLIEYMMLQEYKTSQRHMDSLISKKLGIPIEEEKKIITLLKEYGVIRETKEKYEVLIQVNTGGITHADYSKSLAIKKFWTKKSLELMDNEQEIMKRQRTGLGLHTFTVSEDTDKKVIEALSECFQAINTIVNNDKGPKKIIRVLNTQLLNVYDSSL